MKKADLLLALAFAPLLPCTEGRSQNSEKSPFCTSLNSIISAAAGNFRPIQGAPDPYSDGGEYISLILLPGAEECSVEVKYGASVACSYPESTSVSDLEVGYAGIVGNLGGCLQNWSRKTLNGPDEIRKGFIKSTEFNRSQVTVRVEILAKASKLHPGYTLEVWIDKETGE